MEKKLRVIHSNREISETVISIKFNPAKMFKCVRRQVSWDKLVVLNKGGFLVHRIKTENWNETNI